MTEDLIPFYTPKNILEKSIDCYQYDSNGKKYIDFESGVWCTNIGHSHPRIVKVIQNHAQTNIHHGYLFRNKASEELSKKLHEKIGFPNGQSVFLSSGSEAVNLSVTIARHITKRDKILKIDNSFLSAYGFGQVSTNNPHKVDIGFNDVDAISKIDFSEIAAFVLETGGASLAVVKFPDKAFVSKLITKAKENGVIIIVDEVTTGFGRTGKWFGFMHYGITPDAVVTAKGLGNGYPISCVSINSDLSKKLKDSPLHYLQSHINDPLGCAISLEVIKTIDEENLIETCKKTGEYFKYKLQSLDGKYIKEIRCRGLILGIELSEEINGNLVHAELFEKGFIVGHKFNTIRLLPPLTIKPSDIDELVNAINETLINNLQQQFATETKTS